MRQDRSAGQDEPGRKSLAAVGLDIVGNVLDGCDLWYSIEDVPLQLGVQIRVRVTTGMRDRHPLAAGLSGLCRRSKEVPLADRKANDLDAALEMFPFTSDFTSTVFLIAPEGFVGERPAKLIR